MKRFRTGETGELESRGGYKFLLYTLLKAGQFAVQSGEHVVKVSGSVTRLEKMDVIHNKIGASRYRSFFLSKRNEWEGKRRDQTCIKDYVWVEVKNKNGFGSYKYEKLPNELAVHSGNPPVMCT